MSTRTRFEKEAKGNSKKVSLRGALRDIQKTAAKETRFSLAVQEYVNTGLGNNEIKCQTHALEF